MHFWEECGTYRAQRCTMTLLDQRGSPCAGSWKMTRSLVLEVHRMADMMAYGLRLGRKRHLDWIAFSGVGEHRR